MSPPTTKRLPLMPFFIVPFAKMNGLGNEILVLDMRAFAQDINPQTVRNFCKTGQMRFDQIMALYPPRRRDTDFYVEIFNQDGSLAKSCGNGTRCLVAHFSPLVGKKNLVLETKGGIVQAKLLENGQVCVTLPPPRFTPQSLPVNEQLYKKHPLCWGSFQAPVFVSVGNPHVIFFVENAADPSSLTDIAPKIQHDPLFPEGCNVSFAQCLDPKTLLVRTFERGAGLTQACGSAACACAVAGILYKGMENCVETQLLGGRLNIRWKPEGPIFMTGPAEHEYSGLLDLTTGQAVL